MKNIAHCILILACSFCVAGCSTFSFSSATPVPSASATPVPTPARTGVLTLYMPANPASLDPLLVHSTELVNLLSLICEPMFAADETGFPTPWLAESYEVSDREDGMYDWNITLRAGVKFHNNMEMSADDVVFTLDRIAANRETSIYAPVLDYVVEWTETGAHTLRITANVSFAYFLSALSFPVVCKASYGADGMQEPDVPTGTGPYVVRSSDANSGMRLEVNDSWWRVAPAIKSISVVPLQAGDAALASFAMHALDLYSTLELSTALYIDSSDDKVARFDYMTRYYEFLAPNRESAAFADTRLIHAIAKLIDRNAVITRAYMNHALAVDTPISPDSVLYDNTTATYVTDPAGAREIFDAMGYTTKNADGFLQKDGVPLSIRLLVNSDASSTSRREAAKLIAEQLRGAGIDVVEEIVNWEEYTERVSSGDFDLLIGGYYLSEMPDFRFAFASDAPIETNVSRYKSAAMDTMLNTVVSAHGVQETLSAVGKWQQLFLEELPHIGLYFRTGTLLVDSDIQGVSRVQRERALYMDIPNWFFAS